MLPSSFFKALLLVSSLLLCAVFPSEVLAHGVDEKTRAFLLSNTGVQIIAFMYIGAKHMITGYDHLLFLLGVMFFLFKPKEILLYVSMFTLGHSITLLTGVLANIQINAYLIDALIGFSVVYKAFDNLGGIKYLLGKTINPRFMVLLFGLIHGFGLATKIQEFALPKEGLVTNLLAFNLGVELGQFAALMIILLMLNVWRKYASFEQFSTITNTLVMSAGFMLIGLQLTGYFTV